MFSFASAKSRMPDREDALPEWMNPTDTADLFSDFMVVPNLRTTITILLDTMRFS